MKLWKTLILIIVVYKTEALFKNAFSKIRDKVSAIYKSKYGKDKSLHFLGHDVSEYPGTDKKYLEINKQKWEEYYACLDAQYKNLGEQLSLTPEAVLGFEGNNIRLECKICINPQERQKLDSVVWDWAPEYGKHLEPIEFTEHIIESPEDKTLHIYNLQVENTGQYVCSLGKALTAPYFLTVVDISDTEMTEVHHTEAPLGPYPKDSQGIEGYEIVMDTEWGEWSICSKCDNIGRRHKLGYCTLYLENPPKEDTSSETKTDSENETNIITDTDLELFSIFKYGIPCSSHILPKSIKEHSDVKNRKNEIMTGYCRVKCPKNEVFEVKDKHGKVIERANNSAGIYSLLQSLPPLEPPVERRLEYGVKGKKIILACPGNMNNDAPIQWQIGNKNLIPEIIIRESKGRIFISITDRIHINDAKISDSNIYSCWQQKELAGTIRLIVEKKFEMNFNHHIMLLGIIMILSTFLYVFVKAFFGKKYAKT